MGILELAQYVYLIELKELKLFKDVPYLNWSILLE